MKSRILILLLAIITFGCNDELEIDCDLPPPNWFTINLQNEEGTGLFNSVYSQDSIQLFNENDSIQLSWWVSDEQMLVGFEDIEPDNNYFLKLSSSDTDTLWVQWSSQGELCRSYFLDSLRYNNSPVVIDNIVRDEVVIIKN